MLTFINAGILLLFFVLQVLRTIFTAHMFQLNSYKNDVQFKWFVNNKADCFKKSLLFLVGIVPVFLIDNSIVRALCVLGVFLVSLVLNLPKKAKKPLVYTKRVVRMLLTDFALSVLFVIAVGIAVKTVQVQYCLLLGFSLFSPLVLLLANLLNRPVETAINNYYINDAKKIIRSHKSLVTIGVTGSYGKTSVKFMLGTLLEAKFNVLVTPESYNTTLGVTKTVRSSLRATHDVFVCEMGAKYVGDIKEICDIVAPKHGIITSIGPQHLESFKTLDAVKKTKFELADALDLSGKLFLNGEDENIKSYEHPHPGITYGFSPDKDYYADDVSVSSKGTSFLVHHNGESVKFNTLLLGSHNVLNLLGAIAVCCELGIDLKALPPFAQRVKPVEHRLQLSKNGNTTVIDDSYNANPSGVKAAMNVLSLFDGYKIVITPGMVELGDIQEEENYKFGKVMAEVCDYVVLVGRKQTEPIFKGLTDNGFDESKIFVASSLLEGADKAFSMPINQTEKIVLFENDLPDNY